MTEDAVFLTEDPEDYIRRRAWTRLVLAVKLGRPLSDVYGMGADHAAAMHNQLTVLQQVDGASLRHPATRELAILRRFIRLVGACLFAHIENEEELAREVYGFIGTDNPAMTYMDVWHILFVPSKHGADVFQQNAETTVHEYRLVARLLRQGYTQKEIEELTGSTHRVTNTVEAFGGFQAFRRDMLADAAWRAVEGGLSTSDFATAHGLDERRARRLIAGIRDDVEAAMAEEEMDA